MEKFKKILIQFIEATQRQKKVVLALSCLVVFITTYMLILPAFTLEKEEAAEQGGIDVPEAVLEETSEDEAEPAVQENKAEAGKSGEQSDDSATGSDPETKESKSSQEDKELITEKSAESEDPSEKSVRETLQYEGEGFTIAVEDPKAVLPEDTELVVEELLEKPVDGTKAERKAMEEAYKDYCDQAITAINDESKDEATKTISFAKLYDIKFMSSGEEITPDKPVNVTITYDKDTSKDLKVKAPDDVHIVHFAEDKKTEEVTAELLDKKDFDVTLDKSKMTETTFEAENFSVYGVIYTVVLENEVLTASGDKYKVTVSYGEDAGIPEGAELRIKEIAEKDKEYANLQKDVTDNLKDGIENIPAHPLLLDISIWSDGHEIEPAKGSDVKVEVTLVDNALKGMYTDEESPILINEAPITEDTGKLEKSIQVIHQVEEGKLEVMDTKDTINKKELVSEFTTDSFSNWLVYLDEDLADINLTTGDSLTLRPYSEWVWKKDDEPEAYQGGEWTFPSSDWNSWKNGDYTYYEHKTNGSRFRSYSKPDDQLNETYTVVTSEFLKAGDFDIQTNKGKTIHVHVTEGGSSPKPDTVPGIQGLKVNLFDYDVPYKNGQLDFTHSGGLDASGNTATNAYNQTVNVGHDLKFLGWGADGDGHGVNSYTKENPKQGIVENELKPANPNDTEKYPVVNSGNHQNLKYLFDTSSHDQSVYAFAGADGLFQQDNQGFYYYNSNVNYAEYNQSTNSFVLYEHTYSQNTGGSNGANAKPFGFFPFHEYDTSEAPQPSMNHNTDLNHHFGMSMSVDFEIPKDRQADGPDGQKHDIIYEFSGDDDLWVFVDDELVLDIGGLHQPVTGSINFTTGEIKVHGVDNITKTFNVGAHTMKMFYLERGGCDSNLSVKFNLPLVKGKATLDVAKKSMTNDATEPDRFLSGAVFGVWENEDCSGEPYLTATSDSNGHVDFGYLPVKTEGQKFYIKEIAPPDGYLLNMSVYTATASEKDANDNYTLTITDSNGAAIEKMAQEPKYPIIRDDRPDPIDLSVQKQWKNADGSAAEEPSGTAVFELKRLRTYTNEISQDPIPSGVTTVRAGRVQPSGSWQTTVLDTASIKRGTNATITWSYPSNYNGQRQYRYSTNGGDSGGTWTYSAQNLNRNGSAQIAVPASGELWVYFYDEWNSAVSVSISGAPDQTEQDPILELVTEPDNDFSRTITLPTSGGAWSDTFRNLTVAEQIGDRVYYYSYYIVEKTAPAGYEAVYVDGNGKPISDPSVLATNEDGEQTIVNRKKISVPVEKYWPDYSGDEYTWTASFVLEQMEVKVNEGDPDADDAITEWKAVPGRDPLPVSKDQSPLPEFTNLPMYRVHSNGTVYRILYSVEEVGYEVKENGTVIAQWTKDGSSTGERYTPQFVQDAGENGSGISDYKIILINTIANYTATKEIDLGIRKTWPEGTTYATDNDAYAQFVLKRYVHEEYRDFTDVTEETEWVTVTMLTSTNAQEEGSRRQTLKVPKGTELHITGAVRASTNANKIIFRQSSGQEDIELTRDNTGSTEASQFELDFIADQDKTVSLIQGDNYVVGGRDGFRLSDYLDRSADQLDNGFEEHFTLNSENDWEKLFKYLSVVEESNVDPTEASVTNKVYSYFLEEVECNPSDYEPTFKDSNGSYILGDSSNRVGFSTDIVAENNKKKGALKITKNVTVGGDPASGLDDGRKSLADGTYTFRVYEEDGETPAKRAGSTTPLEDITITITNGVSNSAEVTGLYVGNYVVKEVGSTNPYVSLDTGNHRVTVTAGQTASAGATASITNNYEPTQLTVQKIWQKADGSEDTSKTGNITFTIIQTAYTYNAATGEEIEEIESAVTAYTGTYSRQIGDGDAVVVTNQPTTEFSSNTTVTASDLPLYGTINGTPVKYHYSVRESTIEGYTGIETQDGDGNWTLVNRPAADTDRDTTYTVTKVWRDKDNQPATLKGDESIEFVLKQKAVKTDYLPVTIQLYDPGETREAASKTIYVKKNTTFSYLVDTDTLLGFTHYVYISVNGGASVRRSNGYSGSVTVTEPTSIVASIQNYGLSAVGAWANDPWSSDNIGLYTWIFDYSATQDKIERVDDLIDQYSDATQGVTESEFRYEMLADSITAKASEIGEVAARNFVASFTELPLFRQIGDDSYTYYYSVSEVRVNGEEVVNNQTEDYVVTYGDGTATGITITNTEKEKISVTAGKRWSNADGSSTPPEGASVTFELYRDNQPTGKTVVLNGKIDVADDEDVVNTDTHEKNAAAIEAKAYESAAWTAVWEDLNKYQDDGTTAYVYTIREVSGNKGYSTSSTSVTDGDTITNKQKSTSLDIVKVDSVDANITLEGAKFSIRRIKDTLGANDIQYDGPESDSVTTDDEGKVSFSGITYGYYEIREKQAPKGYNMPDDACFYIRYDDDGIKLLEKDLDMDPKSWDATKTEVGKVSLQNDTATVKNESGAILPHTGGIGTTIFYILGSILVIGCSIFFIARRRASK